MARFAVVVIFALLVTSCFAQERQMSGDRVVGFFGRFMEVVPGAPVREECSRLVKHFGEAQENEDGTVSIPTGSIHHNNNMCETGTMVMYDSPEENPVAGIGESDVTYENFRKSDGFWVGNSTRNCGRWKLPNPTAVFMVYDKDTDLVGPFDVPLSKGNTYMVFTNARYTCIYRDVEKPSPRPSPSASPSSNPVAPVAAQLSEADGETFSSAESINDSDTVGVPVTVLPGVPDELTEASPEDGDGSVCFPADAIVDVEGGVTKRMADISIGDRVRVGSAEFSEVFMFTHKLENVEYEFLKIETESAQISLTKGHYLYVNGVLAAAKAVKVGDRLELASGDVEMVQTVNVIKASGLYNPQTMSGDIVVDGVRASTYTTTVEPMCAHQLLTPLRVLYRVFGVATSAFNNGADSLAKVVPHGAAVVA